jgi:hypothetical protein
LEYPLRFEVHVQTDLGGHQMAWMMDMMSRIRVPIHLDSDQQLILISHDQEIFIDSSERDKTFPLLFMTSS